MCSAGKSEMRGDWIRSRPHLNNSATISLLESHFPFVAKMRSTHAPSDYS